MKQVSRVRKGTAGRQNDLYKDAEACSRKGKWLHVAGVVGVWW